MKMKRIVLTIAAAAAVCLSAGAQNQQAMNGKKTLVAYFSATGITEKVALRKPPAETFTRLLLCRNTQPPISTGPTRLPAVPRR